MITKLSLIDSSSSSLKYSVKTEANLCRKRMISAAFELVLDRARTVQRQGVEMSERGQDVRYRFEYLMCM